MKYLLDTSVWLWTLTASERINRRVREILANGTEELYLSAASSWEISIKSALGKLHLPEPPAIFVPKRLASQGIQPLSITHTHALAVFELPRHHDDPFDRLLIAQARVEDMAIVTADRAFEPYKVKLLWART
jgi:PIN domain nuclease of toxin-antitoxin system